MRSNDEYIAFRDKCMEIPYDINTWLKSVFLNHFRHLTEPMNPETEYQTKLAAKMPNKFK